MTQDSRLSSLYRRGLRRLAALQVAKPLRFLLFGVVTTAIGLWAALQLQLRPGFEELLPDGQPSVTELRRVLERTGGGSAVHIIVEGERPQMRAFADALVPRLRMLGPPWVGSADSGIQRALPFLRARAGFFSSLSSLEQLLAEVEASTRQAVAREVGADLDEDAPQTPPLTEARMRQLLGVEEGKELEAQFPDGYTEARNGKALLIAARSTIPAGDLDRMSEALARVKAATEEVHARPEHAGLKVGYAGDLVTGLFEYSAVLNDLVRVGALGVGLVLLAVLLYFARLRALLVMGLTIAAGCAWTFGFTRLAIGHLNAASGFLFSIVAGNGINFGIIYLARYLEERRRGRRPGRAVYIAHRTTFSATLTVAAAAATAYGSLGVTAFRGFRDFALIGAVGMVLCWFATVNLLPALLVVLERIRPIEFPKGTGLLSTLRRDGLRYEAPFLWLLTKVPATLAVGGGALALVGALATIWWAVLNPLEYDMRKLQSRVESSGELYRVSALARDILGAGAEGAMVVLTDRADQVAPLRAALEERRKAAPPDEAPFGGVRALQDLVPAEQEKKVPILLALRARLLQARGHGAIDDQQWARLEPLLPPPDLKPFSLADLPEDIARSFSERDGTRGRLVLIEPTPGRSDNDLRYLIAWSDSFRETTLPSGEMVRGSGRAVIFADMLKSVLKDMPKAIAVSFLTTAFAVVLAFRGAPGAAAVLITLFSGLAWLGGALAFGGVRINFLNFMALPITLGVGVDYAVNIRRRVEQEGGDALAAIRSSGGAVALCSLTTTLGYLALLSSINQAVRSLGLVAVLGEICCLLAAELLLPAWLLSRSSAAARAGGTRPAEAGE